VALEPSALLGGAPAAAVVFAGDVNSRTAADPRVRDLEARVAAAAGADRVLDELWPVDLRAQRRDPAVEDREPHKRGARVPHSPSALPGTAAFSRAGPKPNPR